MNKIYNNLRYSKAIRYNSFYFLQWHLRKYGLRKNLNYTIFTS